MADLVVYFSFEVGHSESPNRKIISPPKPTNLRYAFGVSYKSELHHALDQKVMMKDQVHGELGEVVAGTKPGRTSSDEIIVFDSTGMALQDVVTSALVYEKARQQRAGTTLPTQISRINSDRISVHP